jgi:iron complex transport system substrate-binding protein
MSSTNVACLSAIGADSLVAAVSGAGYLAKLPYEGVPDIGYEAALDYEKILEIKPDLLVTYVVSGAEPQYITKLRSLGVPVLVLHDHLENHPLARAEYVRLFGALTGRQEQADSVFSYVRDRYETLAESVEATDRVKVLLNIPYADAWYIPGAENYMSQLVRDAAGEVLGAQAGASRSRVVSLEDAYGISQKADIWLNPGHCRTRSQLASVHQLFPSFCPLANDLPIYNNTLRTTPEGGNDFWESGAVRPDLILEDLIQVFHYDGSGNLNYYFRLED